eukprot:10295092-Alexandrium_andersonii.AAC.1
MVRAWVQCWRGWTDRAPLIRAWVIIYRKLVGKPARVRWHHAKGPISALVCQLLEIGWHARLPHQWTAPDQSVWAIPGGPAPMAFLERAILASVAK